MPSVLDSGAIEAANCNYRSPSPVGNFLWASSFPSLIPHPTQTLPYPNLYLTLKGKQIEENCVLYINKFNYR